jgi:hypothetical protein
MPPAHPPVRPGQAPFRFHTYDYPGSQRWTQSNAIATASNMQFYSLLQDMTGLEQEGLARQVPNIVLNRLGPTLGGNRLLELSFGSGSPNAPAVVITGGIHAREWIAAEFVYLLAEYLIMHYTTAPANGYQRSIRRIVDARRIRIIPMLNPDGNLYTVFTAGGRMWRKNRFALPVTAAAWVAMLAPAGAPNPPFDNVGGPAGNLAQYDVPNYDPDNGVPPHAAVMETRDLGLGQFGVDLNRNYDTTAWGYAAERTKNGVTGRTGYDPSTELYFGPSAGSEAETAAVQAELAAIDPGIATSIDYHAYGKLILYPSEAYNAGRVSSDYRKLGQSLRQLVHSDGTLDYDLGTPRQLLGYDATGSIIDHAAEHYQVRAFTIELDPSLGSQKTDGFELKQGQIGAVFEKNIRGALAALAAPRRPHSKYGSYLKKQRMDQTTQALLNWDVYGRGNQLPN